MKYRRHLSLIFCILCHICTLAQEVPQDYFRPPLDGDIALSATFAEFRMNHFHAGLDIRTGGVTGRPVYAVADGYVHCVRISPWGGGKMLYINHPNGYQSVYMHLDAYEGELGKRVLAEQYDQRSYSIVKEFPEGLIRVKKGQLVARSGNTGSSGGPHLHFELRRGGRTVNPLRFGLPYRDSIKPTIRGLRLYPADGQPKEVGSTDAVSIAGPFHLGIYATDAAEGSTLRNGPHSIEVFLDGALFFRYTTEGFPLDSSRMINALLDYDHFAATRQPYLLTRALPGAEGEWVPFRQGDGVFHLQPGTTHRITVKAADIMGNVAERTLRVSVTAPSPAPSAPTVGEPVRRDSAFSLRHPAFCLHLPPYALYADDRLLCTTEEGPYGASLTVQPQVNALPPDQWYTLSLRGRGRRLPKALIVRTVGTKRYAYKTSYADNMYTAEVRDFGCFSLELDTVPPTVRPSNFAEGRPLKNTTLRIKVSDDLGGIDSYHCFLNGQWILAEYDGKTATLIVNAAGKLQPGPNELRVEVSDLCGNTTHRQWTLKR